MGSCSLLFFRGIVETRLPHVHFDRTGTILICNGERNLWKLRRGGRGGEEGEGRGGVGGAIVEREWDGKNFSLPLSQSVELSQSKL